MPSPFCFQKRVVKDAELFAFDDTGRVAEEPETERGFADVWKRDCFAWEYKGKKKNLDEAYRQLLRYRESLLNPPLLVVCDFDRYIIRTNFNGTSRRHTSSPTPRSIRHGSALSLRQRCRTSLQPPVGAGTCHAFVPGIHRRKLLCARPSIQMDAGSAFTEPIYRENLTS